MKQYVRACSLKVNSSNNLEEKKVLQQCCLTEGEALDRTDQHHRPLAIVITQYVYSKAHGMALLVNRCICAAEHINTYLCTQSNAMKNS